MFFHKRVEVYIDWHSSVFNLGPLFPLVGIYKTFICNVIVKEQKKVKLVQGPLTDLLHGHAFHRITQYIHQYIKAHERKHEGCSVLSHLAASLYIYHYNIFTETRL